MNKLRFKSFVLIIGTFLFTTSAFAQNRHHHGHCYRPVPPPRYYAPTAPVYFLPPPVYYAPHPVVMAPPPIVYYGRPNHNYYGRPYRHGNSHCR